MNINEYIDKNFDFCYSVCKYDGDEMVEINEEFKHNANLNYVQISNDNLFVVLYGKSKKMDLFKKNGKRYTIFDSIIIPKGKTWNVSFTNDSNLLAIGGGQNNYFYIYNCKKKKIEHTINTNYFNCSYVTGLKFNSDKDNELLAVTVDTGEIIIYSVLKNKFEIKYIFKNNGWINEIQFSLDKKFLFVCSRDCYIKCFDLSTGSKKENLLKTKNPLPYYDLKISPCGKFLVSADESYIQLWDIEKWKQIGNSISFRESFNCKRPITSQLKTSIYFFDTFLVTKFNQKPFIILWNYDLVNGLKKETKINLDKINKYISSSISCMTINNIGNTLYFGNNDDNIIYSLNIKKETKIKPIDLFEDLSNKNNFSLVSI